MNWVTKITTVRCPECLKECKMLHGANIEADAVFRPVVDCPTCSDNAG